MMITGGIGSGKSSFALRYATGFGREGIRIVTLRPGNNDEQPMPASIPWQIIETEQSMPEVLNLLNLKSNPFRADRRVIVADSLAMDLYRVIEAVSQAMEEESSLERYLSECVDEIVNAVTSYQGMLFVITNELNSWDEKIVWKRLFYKWLAIMNRRIAAKSDQVFLLTAGIAVEITSKRVRLTGGNDL